MKLTEERKKNILKEVQVIKKMFGESIQLPNSQPTIPQQPTQQVNGDKVIESELETMPNSDFHKEIETIRKVSISCVAKLADDPANPLYDFFKKVWTMCDKQQLDKGNKEEKIDVEI